MLLLVTGAYFWSNSLNERRLVAQRELLLGQVDSLVAQIATVSGTSAGTAGRSRLGEGGSRAAEAEDQRLRRNRRRRSSSSKPSSRQLPSNSATSPWLAALDGAAIAAANQDAVAIVFVQFPGGRSFTGTAFAIQSRCQRRTLWSPIVTSWSIRRDASRRKSASYSTARIRISGLTWSRWATRPTWRCSRRRCTGDSGGERHRDEQGRSRGAGRGPGLPLGLDLQKGADWRQLGVAATLTLGTVSRTLPDLIQLDSYGAQGSSGSPIFNRAGMVVGLVYGGEKGSNGRIVYGVPAGAIKELLLRRE